MRLGCGKEAATSWQFVVRINALSGWAEISTADKDSARLRRQVRANTVPVMLMLSLGFAVSLQPSQQSRQECCEAIDLETEEGTDHKLTEGLKVWGGC